jgi:alpha-beta hydrolase superfamily lysophospholipase
MKSLPKVLAPSLMLVGSLDYPVIEMNRTAVKAMRAPCQLKIIEGATHLFEEPGKLEEVAVRVRDWFLEHLAGTGNSSSDN